MPFKQKTFCPNKKSYRDLLVFVSLALQTFKVLAYNNNVHFLNTFLSATLPTVLYLRTSLACVCNPPVTTNFISCFEQFELVLIILYA